MLAGERESGWVYTTLLRDFAVMVKPPKCTVEGIERVVIECILLCNVTKIQECRESLSDVDWDKSLQCCDEDLFRLRMSLIKSQKTHLHECLRVVSSPLLEIPPLFESTEAREWRSKGNSERE